MDSRSWWWFSAVSKCSSAVSECRKSQSNECLRIAFKRYCEETFRSGDAKTIVFEVCKRHLPLNTNRMYRMSKPSEYACHHLIYLFRHIFPESFVLPCTEYSSGAIVKYHQGLTTGGDKNRHRHSQIERCVSVSMWSTVVIIQENETWDTNLDKYLDVRFATES